MSLISRYVFREALGSVLIVAFVLFVILTSNQFAEILGDAANDELPREAVFAVFRLNALWYLTALLPISLFLGIMLALARFNRDSETAAMSACGVGPGRLFRPVAFLALLVAAAAAWLTLVKSPEASLRIEQIKFASEVEPETNLLVPGKFMAPGSDDAVMTFESVSGDDFFNFFYTSNGADQVTVVRAESGRRVRDPETGQVSFRLRNGRFLQGRPGELDWIELEFGGYTIPIAENEGKEFVVEPQMKMPGQLLQSSDPLDVAELQWRIAAPLSILLLALLAVPLSRSSPREGRYAKLGVGLLIYVIYANTQSLARLWLERGDVPAWLGIWWVHAIMAVIALIMFGRVSGWFASARTVSNEAMA